ncbi:MAG TPA: hypothetical protein VF530_03155 [Planctomycetota bacterium]
MSAPVPSRAKLLILALGVCALLVVALGRLPARASRALARAAGTAVREPSPPADLAPAACTSADARSSGLLARAAARPVPVEEPTAQATLAGRVTLDGRAPGPGARVGLRCGENDLRWFPLDPEGRFRVEGVLPGTSVLAFALPPIGGRTVLVPERTVESVPGTRTELALDWRARHVNLKVSGDPGGWNRAQVHLLGAGLSAEVETDDEGRAGLILVEDGRFRLRARHPGGRTGEATLELDEASDLASAVIHLAEPGRS